MIKTNELLMARLQWPSPPSQLDSKELKHYKKILAAARRCLHEAAPITFAEVGFQLLRKTQEAEMVACLDACFEEIELDTSDVLVMLTVPELNEYTEYYYEQSCNLWLNEIGTQVAELADKAEDKPPRVDSFNTVFKHLDVLTGIVEDERLKKIHSYLVKLEDWDYVDEKAKGVKNLRKLARVLTEMTL